MFLHVKSVVFYRMNSALVPSASVYGSNCVDKTYIEILHGIVAETAYANTDILSYIVGETRVMISQFLELDSIAYCGYAPINDDYLFIIVK